jgi:hypothetical protein
MCLLNSTYQARATARSDSQKCTGTGGVYVHGTHYIIPDAKGNITLKLSTRTPWPGAVITTWQSKNKCCTRDLKEDNKGCRLILSRTVNATRCPASDVVISGLRKADMACLACLNYTGNYIDYPVQSK